MRRKAFIITCMITTFLLTACGGRETTNPASATNQTSKASDQNAAAQTEAEDTQVENVEVSNSATEEITLEALLNHAESPAEDFEYWTDGEYAYIDGYLGEEPIVVIPEKLEDCPVKEVGILKGKGIQAIKYSDTVELIRESSFSFDTDLRYVVLGANVKKIDEIAFEGCKNLEYVQLNDSLEEIGEAALYSIGATKIRIPESVIAIGDAAFDMDDTQTIYVKAGSYAESWCEEWKGNFADFKFVVE